MVVSGRLRAIHKAGSEILRCGVSERPDVVLVENSLLTLGKNATTMIADMGLKRNALQIRLEPNHEIRLVSAASGRVSVNGELVDPLARTLLVAGDVISLHAPERAYDYKVEIERSTESAQAPAFALNPPKVEQLADSGRLFALSTIAEEFACAFCLDIQVQATTLVPCGHSFCKSCVVQISECCSCRSAFRETVPCRALDNVIASLVQHSNNIGNVFSPDDVHVYQQRMETANRGSSRCKSTRTKTPKKRKLVCPVVSTGSVMPGETAAGAISID